MYITNELAENLLQNKEKVGLSEVHSSDLQLTLGKKLPFLLFGTPRPSIVLESTAQPQPHLTVGRKRLLNHNCDQRKDRHSGNKERLLVKQVRGKDKKRVISI